MAEALLLSLLARLDRGVVVTMRPDGRPHLSNVNHTFDPATKVLRFSTTDGRTKVRNLRRDPRASYHVTTDDFWQFAVADGTAQVSPVAKDRYDDTVEELVEVYRLIRGEHPDWDDYRRAMVDDGRVVVRINVDRTYGQAG